MVKLGGAEVIKNFGDKFKELKIEGVRTKVVYTLYMGSESEARKRYQNRGNFLRDRGRSFSRSRFGQYDHDRSRSRGRPYVRNDGGGSGSRP